MKETIKLDGYVAISLEDYEEYQALKNPKENGSMFVTGVTSEVRQFSTGSFDPNLAKEINGDFILHLQSSGNCSHLLDSDGKVNFGKLVIELAGNTFKNGFLNDFLNRQ